MRKLAWVMPASVLGPLSLRWARRSQASFDTHGSNRLTTRDGPTAIHARARFAVESAVDTVGDLFGQFDLQLVTYR